MGHFYRPLQHVEAVKVPNVERERAVRLYCSSAETWWTLQLRTPIRLSNGCDGRDFIVATATMDRGDLIALREAIDDALEPPCVGCGLPDGRCMCETPKE